MKSIELCMKYDTCKRCPMNRICEEEYKREMEGGVSGAKDLSSLWGGKSRPHMSLSKKPKKGR